MFHLGRFPFRTKFSPQRAFLPQRPFPPVAAALRILSQTPRHNASNARIIKKTPGNVNRFNVNGPEFFMPETLVQKEEWGQQGDSSGILVMGFQTA